MSYSYETDGAAIYKRSFAIIRAEAKLDRFEAGDEKVAVRIIGDGRVYNPGEFSLTAKFQDFLS